ncbi:Kinesin-1 [Senna tora]|uniref:Kinesin-1 n=1 Tax=Senna tora TaxID=362788 RepID=A0A834TWC9_9FABA|nr:Kinesin-1 [Senna tora]
MTLAANRREQSDSPVEDGSGESLDRNAETGNKSSSTPGPQGPDLPEISVLENVVSILLDLGPQAFPSLYKFCLILSDHKQIYKPEITSQNPFVKAQPV